MNLLILILAVVTFLIALTFLRVWKDLPVLISSAIACAVNINYYLATDYPVKIGSLVFGIDSVVISLLFFIISLTTFTYGAKQAMSLTFNSCVAIFLAGIIQTFAIASKDGSFSYDCVEPLLFYLITIVGTLVSCHLSILVSTKIKNKSLSLTIGYFISSLFHLLFFILAILFYRKSIITSIEAFFSYFLGALIIRTVLIPLFILSYHATNALFKNKKHSD